MDDGAASVAQLYCSASPPQCVYVYLCYYLPNEPFHLVQNNMHLFKKNWKNNL